MVEEQISRYYRLQQKMSINILYSNYTVLPRILTGKIGRKPLTVLDDTFP
jgi:hypothetical protein